MKKGWMVLAILLLCGCAARPAELPIAAAPMAVPEAFAPETTAPTQPTQTVPPDPIDALLDSMTLEQKIGQMFLARCPDENPCRDIIDCHLGGYVLFAKDFDTPRALREKLASFQAAADIPMLIAVDEEGGTVCRVSSNRAFRESAFPSPRELYDQGGMEAVLNAETEKAELLSGLGIHVNLAPVCDVSCTRGAFMYRRSLGQSPEITSQFVSGAVERMAEFRVGSVLKHFPGYGDNADTHTGSAVDTRTLEQLEKADLEVFRAGIRAGCGAVMMSHTIVNALDEAYPVSLSPAAHRYLREQMGFNGVIVTDDLAMQAIADTYGSEEAAVLAVLAGNDLLCSTDYINQYAAVAEAVYLGRISPEQIDSAARRVLSWKQSLDLL